ncbi:uncharacterized protein LOC135673623 isoform X1 [Musa acuminata AAA Group]|uniref:uncharacterized protein LOC103984484 isoform X1 n=2 Tax=Musa acuminata AAA Group TaxID=214697 RepID=UPI0031E0B9A5
MFDQPQVQIDLMGCKNFSEKETEEHLERIGIWYNGDNQSPRHRSIDRVMSYRKLLESMGQDVVLEFDNHFQGRLGHKIVSACSPSSRKVQERCRKGQPANTINYLKNLDGDFRELSHRYSSNLRYEFMHSTSLGCNDENEVLKRGSMYQSSKEVRRMRKLRERRREVESRCTDDDFISFEIVDHLAQHGINRSNQSPHQKFLPPVCSSADSKPTSADTLNSTAMSSMEFLDLSFRDLPDKPLHTNNLCSNFGPAKGNLVDDLLEICLHSVNTRTHCTEASSELLEVGPLKEQESGCHEKFGPESHGKIICERNSLNILPKRFSEKTKMSHTLMQLEYGLAEARDSKNMFSPLKKMFDPLIKSKSLRDSPLTGTQRSGSKVIDSTSITSNGVFEDMECVTGEILTASMSPAHLHGILKLDIENQNPSFEFSLQDPEDTLSAKTWKTDSAFNWVYTFHSSRKKNTNYGTKDKHGQSPPLVGQMQVSCYICSEVKDNGSLVNSTVAEFVLYDIARARRHFVVEERSKCSSDSIQPVTSNAMGGLVAEGPYERNNSVEHPDSSRHGFGSSDSRPSTSYPWTPKDLHPRHEIAAIVTQIPFSKKDSLKDMKVSRPKESQNLSRSPTIDQGRERKSSLNPAMVKVVTPSGAHGLPDTVEGGPSSLLNRWRFGGGCDCGGWDMACPIVVFDNSHADDWIDHSTCEIEKSTFLFVQGKKEKLPALSISADGKGLYSVDFHAQLSALQAFSICIAILHGSEVSSAVIQEKIRQRFYSNSLKLLLEEEVRQLIEAVATEEQIKAKKGTEQMPPSFFLDPPFSPMGRV